MISLKLIIILTLNCLAPSLARRCGNKTQHFDVKGLLAPVFTPVDDNGELNLDIIPDYAQYLKDNDVKGVVIAAYTGEGPTLAVDEVKSLISAWIQAVEPLDMKILAMVSGRPFPDVLELAEFSERERLDAIVTFPELFYKPQTTNQLVYALSLIANVAPSTPLIYYDTPRMTDVSVDIVSFAKEATRRIPTFKGIGIDNADDGLRLLRVMEKDQRIYIANSSYLAPAVYLGADSFAFTEINIIPDLVKDIIKEACQGHLKDANKKFAELLDFSQIVISEDPQGEQIPPYKDTMTIVTGLDMGRARDPQCDIGDKRRAQLRKDLEDRGYATCTDREGYF